MRYLITGGCGFMGSNLASKVLAAGDELMVFDNLSRQGSVDNLQWLRAQGEFTHLHGDIRIASEVQRAVRDYKPDVVFHLSGQVAMTTSLANPRLDFEVNAGGTFNLLEAVRTEAPEAAVLFSSTNKVYGDLEWANYDETETRYVATDHPRGFDERTPLDFQSPYGVSKGSADQYMRDYARMFGIRTVVFRHSSMYGGRQFATYDQGWIGWFARKAVEIAAGTNQAVTISGTGKQVRDVLHAEDICRLYMSAISRIDDVAGQAFNIGGGMDNSLSLLELFKLLEELELTRIDYERLPVRKSDQKVFVADIAKAEALLGWKPEIGVRKGVLSMLEWVKQIG